MAPRAKSKAKRRIEGQAKITKRIHATNTKIFNEERKQTKRWTASKNASRLISSLWYRSG